MIYFKVIQSTSVVANGIQRLEAGKSWAETRQKTILFMRDEILKAPEEERVDKVDAYSIAENNYILAAEIYKNIDPLFLLAIQWRESKFESRYVYGHERSSKGATGIAQFMPTTAKVFVRVLNKQWSESYLTDPIKNTELAAAYLDVLIADYSSKEEILSAYNCCYEGPEKYKNGTLPIETKNYIRDVLKKYKEYKDKMHKYEVT